jgi:tetratricopeptide (TPR) repeat protein
MLLAVRLRVAELAEDIDRFAEAEEHFRTVADGLAAQAAVEPGDVLVRGMRLNALLRAARLQSSLGRKLDSAATALALAAEADALHDANASGRPLPPPLPPASSSSPPSASGAPGVPPAKPPSGPRRRRRGVEGPTGPPEWLRPRADLADLEFSPATLRWVSAFARVAAGKAYDDAERPAEAAAALEDGLDRMSRLIEPLEKAGHTESVYAVHRETGDVCAILGRWAEAAEAFARARAVAERLAEHAPPRGSDNYGFRARGPEMLLRSVPPLCRLGRTGEALAAATEAVRLLRQLVASDPGSQHLRRSLATGLMELSTVLAARGEFAGVVAAAAEARPMFEDLIAKGPAVQTNRLAMAGLTCNLGVALCYLGRREESLAAFADLVRQGEGLVRDFPDDRRARRLLAYDGHYNIATVHTHFAAAALKDAALPEAQRRRRADEWCGLAVTALRRAVEAGYRDVGAAEKDPELDILRDRDDFKALMADWRKRLAATPGVR